jgi:hypothetical protein
MAQPIHRIGLLAVLSSVLLISPLQAAEQWVRIKTDKFNNAWYVDKNSIAIKGKDRLFWLYVVNPKPDLIDGQSVTSFGAYLAVNCQSQKVRPQYMRLMDKNNQPVREIDLSSAQGRKLLPNKINEGAIASTRYVCSSR